jgi:hypothetical protein
MVFSKKNLTRRGEGSLRGDSPARGSPLKNVFADAQKSIDIFFPIAHTVVGLFAAPVLLRRLVNYVKLFGGKIYDIQHTGVGNRICRFD